jgi:hypothetical protein
VNVLTNDFNSKVAPFWPIPNPPDPAGPFILKWIEGLHPEQISIIVSKTIDQQIGLINAQIQYLNTEVARLQTMKEMTKAKASTVK